MDLSRDHILDAISYSRGKKVSNTVLSKSESILAHQYLHLKIALPTETRLKITRIVRLTEDINWKRPIVRYNSELQEEQLNQKTGTWKIIKKQH